MRQIIDIFFPSSMCAILTALAMAVVACKDSGPQGAVAEREKSTAPWKGKSDQSLPSVPIARPWPTMEAVELLTGESRNRMIVELLGRVDEDAGMVRELLRAMVSAEPEAGIAWCDAHPELDKIEVLRAAVVDTLAGSDPQQALDQVLRINGTMRTELLENLFHEWSGENIEQAASVASGMAGSDRLLAFAAIGEKAMAGDPKATMQWVLAMPPTDIQDMLLLSTASAWAHHAPEEAAAFASELPDDDYKTVMARELAEAWANNDPDAAVQWSAGLQNQESRNEALRAALAQVFQSDPARSAGMAVKLPDSSERLASLEWVVEKWHGVNATAAGAWVESQSDTALKSTMQRWLDDSAAVGGK